MATFECFDNREGNLLCLQFHVEVGLRLLSRSTDHGSFTIRSISPAVGARLYHRYLSSLNSFVRKRCYNFVFLYCINFNYHHSFYSIINLLYWTKIIRYYYSFYYQKIAYFPRCFPVKKTHFKGFVLQLNCRPPLEALRLE